MRKYCFLSSSTSILKIILYDILSIVSIDMPIYSYIFFCCFFDDPCKLRPGDAMSCIDMVCIGLGDGLLPNRNG